MRSERLCQKKIWNRSSDLPLCSTIPESLYHRSPLIFYIYMHIYIGAPVVAVVVVYLTTLAMFIIWRRMRVLLLKKCIEGMFEEEFLA
jgi:hypothetical protein